MLQCLDLRKKGEAKAEISSAKQDSFKAFLKGQGNVFMISICFHLFDKVMLN
jgi:hypothetical protein